MQATRLRSLGGEDPLKKGFLPVESHGQKSLAGYNPWGRKESKDTTCWKGKQLFGFRCKTESNLWRQSVGCPLTQRKWQGRRIKHNHLGPTLGASRYNLTLKDRTVSCWGFLRDSHAFPHYQPLCCHHLAWSELAPSVTGWQSSNSKDTDYSASLPSSWWTQGSPVFIRIVS